MRSFHNPYYYGVPERPIEKLNTVLLYGKYILISGFISLFGALADREYSNNR